MSDLKKYWVGFNLVKGIGSARTRALLDHFDSLEQAWNADRSQLLEAGLGEKTADNLIQVRRRWTWKGSGMASFKKGSA